MDEKEIALSVTMMTDEALSSDLLGTNRIRFTALCIFRQGNRILVAEYFDSRKASIFYRPVGGEIKFGEYSANTIVREVAEELQATVIESTLHCLGSIENIFTYDGQLGHEIVVVYDGRFADPALYEATSLRHIEGADPAGRAVWKGIDEFGKSAPLYPERILTLLESIE